MLIILAFILLCVLKETVTSRVNITYPREELYKNVQTLKNYCIQLIFVYFSQINRLSFAL
jgi:hypothetical protein